MVDPRLKRLAEVLVNYSCRVKPGENVMLRVKGKQTALACCLVDAVYAAKGRPFLRMEDSAVMRSFLKGADTETVKLWAECDAFLFDKMQAFITIDAMDNATEYADIPQDRMQGWALHYGKPVYNDIVGAKTNWVLCGYPTASAAQAASMSTEAFEDFFFHVCCLDYAKMSKAMDALVGLMAATERVRLIGPGTDLTLSIKGQPVIKCDGINNMPDGEVFTSPIRNSVNGIITYNTPSIYQGKVYENVRFEFKDGRIISASGSDSEHINKLLDTDEGARYIGEFAIGVNPCITQPMRDTLFDEKIAGSFHLTPGNAYPSADNGNRSAIHWDLVNLQTPEYGGGEMYFDDVLVRKDGRYVLSELLCLNPENLI